MLINTRFFLLASMAVVILGLYACETMHGAGHDIENAGEAVQDAAD